MHRPRERSVAGQRARSTDQRDGFSALFAYSIASGDSFRKCLPKMMIPVLKPLDPRAGQRPTPCASGASATLGALRTMSEIPAGLLRNISTFGDAT